MTFLKRTYVPLLLIFIFVSCVYNDVVIDTCGTSDPVNDLPWLKSRIKQLEAGSGDLKKYFYIAQAEYQNRTVFVFGNCCPLCNTITPVYDCDGTLLFSLDATNQRQIKHPRICWKPEPFACDLP